MRTGRSPAEHGVVRFSTDFTSTGSSSAPMALVSRSRSALMSCCHSGGMSIALIWSSIVWAAGESGMIATVALAELRQHPLAELADRLQARVLGHGAHLDQEHDFVGAHVAQPFDVRDGLVGVAVGVLGVERPG